MGRRGPRAISHGGRRVLPAAVTLLAAAGAAAGTLVAVLSGPPHSSAVPPGSPRFGLPAVQPSNGDASVIAGVPLTVGAGVRLLSGSPVPAVQTPSTRR